MARHARPDIDLTAIRKSPLLGGMSETVLARLLERAELVEIGAGATLIRQGDPGDKAYVILSGALDVVLETALGEVAMARLLAPQIVGEIAVFTDLRRTATVRAAEASRLLGLSRAVLVELIEAHPGLAFDAIGALGRRINAMSVPLALLTLAAQALERPDLDPAGFDKMLESVGDTSPFALSFRRIVREMGEKNARRHEMEFAARLQQSILPETLSFPPASPYRAAAFMRPAREIGGDFYDFVETEDGRVVLIVADVSGKGIPAALFMAVSRTMLRATVRATATIEDAITRANAQLEADNREGLFVTVFAVELHPATGRVRYVNAGHCDGYVRSADGRLRVLEATGPAMAMVAGRKFEARETTLAPGELLFVASDGITEAFAANGAMFGEARLMDLLEALREPGVAAAIADIDAAVSAFAAGCEQSDDITCLALARR